MNRRVCLRVLSPLLLTGFLILTGCGGPAEQKVVETKMVVPTQVDSLRTSLEALAQSGQFDSGTPLLKDAVSGLQGVAGVDVGTLSKEVDELLAMTNASQIKAKAKQIADKLPK